MSTFATSVRSSTPTLLGRARPQPIRAPSPAQRLRIRHILHGPRVQPRLMVGPSNDALESEADRVADQVMRVPEPTVQRACARGGTCAECRSEGRNSGTLRRAPNPPGGAAPASPAADGGCSPTSLAAINAALTEARAWRRQASAWLANHLNALRRRVPASADAYAPIGTTAFGQLTLLDRHFRIRDRIRALGSRFPVGTEERVNARDLENYGNASYSIRRAFADLDLSRLTFTCQAPCPPGRTGTDTLGSAVPGSFAFTIYTDCFDPQHAKTQAGVVLHEAFHATYSEFNHDTYSFESDYPGRAASTNAESLAMFAAIAATGSTYRIVLLPETQIHAAPSP